MNMQNPQDQNKSGGIHPAAYIFVASGGGIVGLDYATWMEVTPVVGALIGGVISLVILGIATGIIEDRKEIEENLMKAGGVIGFLIGAVGAHNNGEEGFAWIIGGIIGGCLGVWAGKFAAGAIVLFAAVTLLLSQGPIGMAVRAFITGQN